MTIMAIIVEKVMKPEIFANALQKEIYTVQVHRRNNFWDYKAVEAAQAELSLTAFQLYMYLERQNTNAPWCVWPSKLAKETQLDEYTLLGAVIELKKRATLPLVRLNGTVSSTRQTSFTSGSVRNFATSNTTTMLHNLMPSGRRCLWRRPSGQQQNEKSKEVTLWTNLIYP